MEWLDFDPDPVESQSMIEDDVAQRERAVWDNHGAVDDLLLRRFRAGSWELSSGGSWQPGAGMECKNHDPQTTDEPIARMMRVGDVRTAGPS
jgi:hypothetical protein